MRRSQASRVYREFPAEAGRLSVLPRQSGEALSHESGQPPDSRVAAAGRPYRIIQRNGEWFVEFTQNDGLDAG